MPPLAEPEAVALFCERAQVEASEEIAELCTRLDNLPLAVELAAARTKALSPAQILERLSGRLDLLKGGREADPRQLTLRATIEWSYDLLTPEEQELFARLSVFAGGCTLEAAEEVADADLDTLQSLVEKSLLRFTDERYWMLETIRELAWERLVGGDDVEDISRGHAHFYSTFAEDTREKLAELSRSSAIAQLELELPNIRNSLAWFRSSEDVGTELRLLRALGKFWLARDHIGEGEGILMEALARIPEDGSELRLRVELDLGEIALRRGNTDDARRSVERWLGWARERNDPSQTAWALSSLASITTREGAFVESVSLLEEALLFARPTGDVRLTSNILGNLGYALCGVGGYERAVEVCSESIRLAPAASDAGIDHANLGLALLGLGDGAGAGSAYRVAIASSLESGYFFTVADALVGAAAVAVESGSAQASLVILAAVGSLRTELGLPAEPLEHDLGVRTEKRARSALGEDADSAWAEGHVLSMDEAVEFALASID